ncbi:exonuclease 1 [Stomoxys calcitrans]|uniref:exonuclease 1 n=1 Tax=Stomoxys calcitrans TaxID=35570 RepID=UPI0027E2D5D5|nr:exonuclease 1 [Stomoxys calcitrans]
MGISGLIPFLEKASKPVDIRELQGTSVAVDSYCWLHKGVFACAEKLVRGEDTDIYIQYCLKFVEMLKRHKIKVIMVFDGRHLPAKAETERKRREARQESKKLAKEYLRQNDIEKARSHMRRAVDVTHEMALRLIKACRERNVDCIVAPYEADAQMAWLNKQGLAEYIITEDSDLTLFGALRVLFKLDLQGNALLVESNKLHLAMGCKPEKYTFDKFLRMCILSGCDYLDSLQGIGLKKACKFIMTTEEDDMTKALKKMPQYLKMRQLEVTDKYIENFLKAEATFKHMYIYNPLKKRMERLHDLDVFGTDEKHCSNAGSLLDDEDLAFQLALGNLNPFTLQKMDDWHPEKSWSNTGSKSRHPSIWKSSISSIQNNDSTSNDKYKGALLPFKKIEYKNMAETELQEQLSQENSKLEEAEVFSIYNLGISNRKRKRVSSDSSDDTEQPSQESVKTPSKSHNPFAVSYVPTEDKPNSPVCTNRSLLKVLSPHKNQTEPKNNKICVDIKSRFFAQNIKRVSKKPFAARDLTEDMTKIEEKSQSSVAIKKDLYNDLSPQAKADIHKNKISNLENKMDQVSSDGTAVINDTVVTNITSVVKRKEIIEILSDLEEDNLSHSSYTQTTLYSTQSSSNSLVNSQKCLGLAKPKKKTNLSTKGNKSVKSDSKQPKLSMFGFQKRPTLKKI